MSHNLTEKFTLRLTMQQVLAVERLAKNRSTTKTSVLRGLITSGLDNCENLNQKILVEMLMILRESIKEDEGVYVDILKARDEFKKAHGIE